jgi:rSAM-partnered protein
MADTDTDTDVDVETDTDADGDAAGAGAGAGDDAVADAGGDRGPDPTSRDRTVVDAPRSGRDTEWEVFRRGRADDDLRHVGSVRAPTVEAAHEHAGTLFDAADSLWLCPADAVHRVTAHDLAADDGTDGADSAASGGDRP